MSHFLLTFVGVNLTFLPIQPVGLAGLPRRIPDSPDAFYVMNSISSIGSAITMTSIAVFITSLVHLFISLPLSVNRVSNYCGLE